MLIVDSYLIGKYVGPQAISARSHSLKEISR
jgi:hypothetical protein